MRSYTVEGIILKKSKVGEADHIITLFTREHGKMAVIAKGVRKITSKRAGSLQLFNHVKVSIVPGKTSLSTLAEVQVINAFPTWRRQLGRVTLAFQLCEIIDKLTVDNQAHPEIFDLLSSALSQIQFLQIHWSQTSDSWLVQIVQELGFLPDDKPFQGDIQKYIEDLSERPLNSPKLLSMLKSLHGRTGQNS